MSHQLFRLREKIYNTPQLMAQPSFETICDYLDARCSEDFKLETSNNPLNKVTDRYSFNADIGVATLSIDGPLTNKPITIMGMECGGTSYQQLKEDFTYLVDNGAKTIAMMISSGGGEAYGVFDAANYIRSYANANDVTILSYVDGLSASAAYALTAISDQIITNSQSELGSIGVIVCLMNDSKALEMEGYERTFISAGAEKTPFANDGSFKDSFLADIQSKVDTLYTSFTEFVADARNISVEAVKSTEAKTFLAGDALKLGLADSVMTSEEFYVYLAEVAESNQSTSQGNSSTMLKNKLFNMNKTNDTKVSMESLDMNELELAKSELSALQLAFKTKESELQLALTGVVDLQAKLSSAHEAVAQFKAEKESAELAAKALVVEARTTKLSALLGDEPAKVLLASLDGLSDAQFEAVVASHEASAGVVGKNALFVEMGADSTAAASEPEMQSILDKLIKEQYKTK